MNRRGFLKLIAQAAAAAKMPLVMLPPEVPVQSTPNVQAFIANAANVEQEVRIAKSFEFCMTKYDLAVNAENVFELTAEMRSLTMPLTGAMKFLIDRAQLNEVMRWYHALEPIHFDWRGDYPFVNGIKASIMHMTFEAPIMEVTTLEDSVRRFEPVPLVDSVQSEIKRFARKGESDDGSKD